MIYSFSPNWYKPQCLHFSGQLMYYCSNYLLYRYDLPTKRVNSELCLRQIAIQHQINHKDIKINAISSDQSLLIVSINQPYVFLIDKQSMSLQTLVPLKEFIAQYIHLYHQEDVPMAILANKDGTLVKINLRKPQQPIVAVETKHKSSALKYIYSIHKHHLAIFTRGSILVYNEDFTILQKVVQFTHNHTVFSIDCFIRGKDVHFCLLTKCNESYFISLFKLNIEKEFLLQQKKKIDEICDGFKRFQVSWHYPNKFMQKLKNNQKASMTAKLLSETQVVLTGKLGEIVTLKTTLIEDATKICIKPYSYEEKSEQEIHYYVWPDSKHYKEIYYIYQHHQRLYMISTDHNLSVWQLDHKNSPPRYIYSIKFLTAAVQSFFYSQQDPRNIFALLKDSAIRCFTPLDTASHQINQFWKFSKKFTIKKAVCHPTEEGVLALLTECNKIQIYDVYQDRLMKLIELQEPALMLSFESASVRQEIQKMFNYELAATKLQYIAHFKKPMSDENLLMVQTNNNLLLVNNLSSNQMDFYVGKRQKRFERIHENRFWDGRTLLCSVTRKSSVDIHIRHLGTKLQHEEHLAYSQGKVLFKSIKNSNQISIYNFKGNKISIKKFTMLPQQQKLLLTECHQISLNYPVDFLHLNYVDARMLVYSQRNDIIIVIDAHQLKGDTYHINSQTPYSQLYRVYSKIDTLCFYFERHLIMATKDQTIKILEFSELQLLECPAQQSKGQSCPASLESELKAQKNKQPEMQAKMGYKTIESEKL